MMKEIMGGLWFAGLVAWALFGLVPGIILIVLGAAAGAGELVKEQKAEATKQAWRKYYPPYRY